MARGKAQAGGPANRRRENRRGTAQLSGPPPPDRAINVPPTAAERIALGEDMARKIPRKNSLRWEFCPTSTVSAINASWWIAE
jgi:hypothetical protein